MATKTRSKSPAKPRSKARSTAARNKSGGSASQLRNASGKSLVIVESPAKARTVGQILGSKYLVTASQGHVRDLPKSKIGVDVDDDFTPSYVIMQDKRAIVNALKKAGSEATQVYLATDPDREGEAISWHLQTAADWDGWPAPPKRVVFHEITKQAVEEAFQHPRDIDMQLVNAQQARRILDRLVGYQISPLLWRRVQRGLSAGRVQSVALRMVVDREREIEAFVPVESWTLEAQLRKQSIEDSFTAMLHSVKGQKGRLSISNEQDARSYQAQLDGASYAVSSVKKKDVRQRPRASLLHHQHPAAGGRPQAKVYRSTYHGRCPATLRRPVRGSRGLGGSDYLYAHRLHPGRRIGPERGEVIHRTPLR